MSQYQLHFFLAVRLGAALLYLIFLFRLIPGFGRSALECCVLSSGFDESLDEGGARYGARQGAGWERGWGDQKSFFFLRWLGRVKGG